MRRILAIRSCSWPPRVALLVAGSGAGGDEGTYEVRAIFDNARLPRRRRGGPVRRRQRRLVAEVDITGADEPVREDGSPEPGKAIVILRIDDPGFQDFRDDASCLIRPQSLIGEKFVECEPTQPRAPGSQAPPELESIPEGEPGEGQYLLPLERNGKAVDLDLVNNIMERALSRPLPAHPQRPRGRPRRPRRRARRDHRARQPGAARDQRVLAILRDQNRALADLARRRRRGAHRAGPRARAARRVHQLLGGRRRRRPPSAGPSSRRASRSCRGFLRELRSTMTELARFSDAGDARVHRARRGRALAHPR